MDNLNKSTLPIDDDLNDYVTIFNLKKLVSSLSCYDKDLEERLEKELANTKKDTPT